MGVRLTAILRHLAAPAESTVVLSGWRGVALLEYIMRERQRSKYSASIALFDPQNSPVH